MKNKTMLAALLLILLVLVGGEILLRRIGTWSRKKSEVMKSPAAPADSLWQGPDSAAIPP
jgi:hypothetical protein